MANNKIEGIAKRYDGAPVDYVSIFNWVDGQCIAQVIPDALGSWSYKYNQNLRIGITYVADGCEPIAHGAYDFLYEYNSLLDAILHYDFNGNVLDQSANALNGIKTGVANFVAGRKAGTQALEFIAGCVRTPIALPINSDKLTVSFWISTSQSNSGLIYESSNSNANPNTVGSFLNDYGTNTIDAIQRTTPEYTGLVYSQLAFDNTWHHIIIELDRARDGADEQKIYIDNVLTSTPLAGYTPNLSGNLENYILYIGQRAASSFSLNAKLQDFRVYNRVLTADERTILFNE